jgi:hypothetical protein
MVNTVIQVSIIIIFVLSVDIANSWSELYNVSWSDESLDAV